MGEMAKEITRITAKAIHDMGCDIEDLMEKSHLRIAHLEGVNAATFELLRELRAMTKDDEIIGHMEKKVRKSHDELSYQKGYTAGIKSIVDTLNVKKQALLAAIDNPNVGERPDENRVEELAKRKSSKNIDNKEHEG
jgi:hypothetical protein